MFRTVLFVAMLGLPSAALSADYYPSIQSPDPAPPIVAQAPVFEAPEREPFPIIMLPAFWSEIRKSATVAEVVDRLRMRFGPAPIVFRGTTGRAAIPIQVTVGSVYRREEDVLIELPSVTVDLFVSLEGRPSTKRTVTVPLYPQTSSAYR